MAIFLFGALLIQVPSEVAADSSSYQAWVQNIAKPKFGAWAGIFSFLRLFDVFHSPWFLIAGGLLMINILFCTMNRWNSIYLVMRGGKVKPAREFFSKGTDRKELSISETPDKAGMMITDILKQRHYRVRTQDSSQVINIAADKNRFSSLGTLFTHLSLIIFVLGFVITGFWGFRDVFFVVAESTINDVGHNTGLSLELKSFEDEYWPNGSPKDFRSQVVLYDEGQEVKQSMVRVNSPLSYRGVNFYQATFGTAAKIQVSYAGQMLYDDTVALTQMLGDADVQRPAGLVDLPQVNKAVGLLGPAPNGIDPIIGQQQLGILLYNAGEENPIVTGVLETGMPRELEGLQFTFVSGAQYSGFQVSRSPGTAFIWIACGLIIVGLCLVYYFPVRQAWVLVEPKETGKSQVILRFTGKSGLLSKERDELTDLIERKHSGEG